MGTGGLHLNFLGGCAEGSWGVMGLVRAGVVWGGVHVKGCEGLFLYV